MKRICRFLVESGFEVHLISRHENGLDPQEFEPAVHIHQLKSNRLIKKFFQIKKILHEVKPDVVHLNYLTKDALIPALILRRGYRYVITIWGSDINTFSRKWFNRLLQNLGLILCDRIQLLSPYFEKKIKQFYWGIRTYKLDSFSWGIDCHFFSQIDQVMIDRIKRELKIGQDDFLILSYRNHQPSYNHHLTIRAIPEVIRSVPTARFIFTHSGMNREYYEENERLVQNLGVADHFVFIDRWLSDEELRALIQCAHVSINIPFQDGLPATLLEIMTSRAIPVVSHLDNYLYFFKENENGLYLKNLNDALELANLIVYALKNYSSLSAKFCQKNNDYVWLHQNWEIQSQKLLKFYGNA